MVLGALILLLCMVLSGFNCVEIETTTGGAAVFYLPSYSSHCGPYTLVDPNNNTVLLVDGVRVVIYGLYNARTHHDTLSNGTIRLGLHRVTEADTGTYVLKYEPRGLFCPANYFSVSLADAAPQWLEWSPWSRCTRTCGANGFRHRQRVCSERGQCPGDYEEHDRCTLEACQHSYWLNWGEWSSCSVTCSEGQKTRRRTCSTSTGCNGSNEDHSVCKEQECKQAAWTDWSRWIVCSQTCGGGTSYRTRQCRTDDVTDICEGSNRDTIECNSQPCPNRVDRPRERPTTAYSWTSWSEWSTCRQLCGREFRRRQRKCTDDTRRPVSAGYCGNGEGEESVDCNHPPCNRVVGGARSSTTADHDIGITVPLSGIVGTVAVLFIIILLVVVIILVVRLRKKNNAHRNNDAKTGSSSRIAALEGIGRDKSSERLKKSVSISEENESHLYAEIDEEVYQKRNKSKSIVTLDNPYSDLPKSATPTTKHPGVDDTAYYNNTGTEAQIFLFGPNASSSETLLNVPKSEPIKHGQSNTGAYDGGYLTCTPTSSQEQLDRQPKRYVKAKR